MIMLGVVMPQSFSNIPQLCSKVCHYVLNVSYLVTNYWQVCVFLCMLINVFGGGGSAIELAFELVK